MRNRDGTKEVTAWHRFRGVELCYAVSRWYMRRYQTVRGYQLWLTWESPQMGMGNSAQAGE